MKEWITTSLEAARVANRKHGQVLMEIARLKGILPMDAAHDFHYVNYIGPDGVPVRLYHLTAFGLAMLDVGKHRSALLWKAKKLTCRQP